MTQVGRARSPTRTPNERKLLWVAGWGSGLVPRLSVSGECFRCLAGSLQTHGVITEVVIEADTGGVRP